MARRGRGVAENLGDREKRQATAVERASGPPTGVPARVAHRQARRAAPRDASHPLRWPAMTDSETRSCPICQSELDRSTRGGAHADLCPDHGVWLDRGELERVLSNARRSTRASRRQIEDARRKGVWSGLFWGAWALLDDGGGGSRRQRKRVIPTPETAADNAALVPEGARKCPVCAQTMQVEARDNVVIDACVDHGVWLDGDELEGMIGRAKNRSRIRTSRAKRRARRDGVIDANLWGLFSLLR